MRGDFAAALFYKASEPDFRPFSLFRRQPVKACVRHAPIITCTPTPKKLFVGQHLLETRRGIGYPSENY